eukprot:8068980-Pyramimonas_sp.AAC.1
MEPGNSEEDDCHCRVVDKLLRAVCGGFAELVPGEQEVERCSDALRKAVLHGGRGFLNGVV